MVVGGGIGGMQSALDLAESGLKVYMVENKPCVGGVMAQLDKTFPTNDCAMCTMAPRLVELGRHKDIEIITLADTQSIKGQPGNFTVTLNKRPRYVDEDKCTGCGICTEACPVRNEIYFPPDEDAGKVELKPEDEARVNRIIEANKDRPGALMPILQAINADYNYCPEEVLRYVAMRMEVPMSLILRIVTFYDSFSLKPRGRHSISVCMGTTCYVRGAGKILDRLSEMLGVPPEETTDDLRFTLKSVRCLGCCSIAPAIMVDGKAYGRLKLSDLSKIVDEYE